MGQYLFPTIPDKNVLNKKTPNELNHPVFLNCNPEFNRG